MLKRLTKNVNNDSRWNTYKEKFIFSGLLSKSQNPWMTTSCYISKHSLVYQFPYVSVKCLTKTQDPDYLITKNVILGDGG